MDEIMESQEVLDHYRNMPDQTETVETAETTNTQVDAQDENMADLYRVIYEKDKDFYFYDKENIPFAKGNVFSECNRNDVKYNPDEQYAHLFDNLADAKSYFLDYGNIEGQQEKEKCCIIHCKADKDLVKSHTVKGLFTAASGFGFALREKREVIFSKEEFINKVNVVDVVPESEYPKDFGGYDPDADYYRF